MKLRFQHAIIAALANHVLLLAEEKGGELPAKLKDLFDFIKMKFKPIEFEDNSDFWDPYIADYNTALQNCTEGLKLKNCQYALDFIKDLEKQSETFIDKASSLLCQRYKQDTSPTRSLNYDISQFDSLQKQLKTSATALYDKHKLGRVLSLGAASGANPSHATSKQVTTWDPGHPAFKRGSTVTSPQAVNDAKARLNANP